MIGLIVQYTAEIVKIWSTSSRRIITYSRDDIPHDCHEGDWINIVFDSNGVLTNIRKTKDVLETKRDERGKLQVLDIFLVNPRRDKAYSERFGSTMMENGEEEEGWTEGGSSDGHRFLLWMTISSRCQFLIEKQPLEKTYSYGKNADLYRRMMEEAGKLDIDIDNIEEADSFNENILIVGYDTKWQRFFSSSLCGESVIHKSEWVNKWNLRLGEVYHATLRKTNDEKFGMENRVINILKRASVWEGVEVEVQGKEIRVELNGKIVGQRETCFALETLPFGLVTYPTDLNVKSVPENVQIGDYLRVRISRFKSTNTDHPSKWQVKKLIKRLPLLEEKGGWFEGIVTFMNGSRILISFKHGNAEYSKTCDDGDLRLGTILDIRVRDTGLESYFKVCEIGSQTRIRDDMRVEKKEDAGKTMFSLFCPAEVRARRDRFFLLEIPIIGTATLFFKECPRNMNVGEIWNVALHRRKEKRDLPSHWVAHAVVGDYPIEKSMNTRGHRGDSELSLSSAMTCSLEEDGEWGTVVITGADGGAWFASCYLADTIVLPPSLVDGLAIPERGTFYRIKCFYKRGRWLAYELNRNPVFPKDYEVVKDKNHGALQVICYATIESTQSNAFTIFNKILGEATLPHQFAYSEMKVGDVIEALYYRVKSTHNPTHWMVKQCKRVSGRVDSNRAMERNDGNEERRMEEEGEKNLSNKKKSSDASTSRMELSSRIEQRNKKDRRVLDKMNYFLSLPKVNEMFERRIPKEKEIIDIILDYDRLRFQ